MKKTVFVFALMLAAITTTEQAQACDMCGPEKIMLIDQVESLVQQISLLNEEYDTMKGVVSAEELATFKAHLQQQKQELIDLAIDKVQSI